MSGRDGTEPSVSAPTPEREHRHDSDIAQGTVEGERSIPSVNRARSLQSRLSSVLAIGLMAAIGLGLLTWYYAGLAHRSKRNDDRQAVMRTRAQGEMPLPPLGPILAPATPSASARAIERLLGPAPEPPSVAESAAWLRADSLRTRTARTIAPRKAAREIALDRRLTGVVFTRERSEAPAAARLSAPSQLSRVGAYDPLRISSSEAPTDSDRDSLAALLQPTVTAAARARMLPTRSLLLGKGSNVDCTLETAVDSTLPGMTICITATDTFGVDGTVVLLERGTKLVGETRGQVQQGAARLFIVWVEARTPTGVVVPLSSPGTDALGRAGVAGRVNRHFWDRFGAAILVTVIDGAIQGAARTANSADSTIILNPTTSRDVMTEVLKGTIAIPPTITVSQGERIQVLVARDVDFRSVYELRMVAASNEEGDEQ